MSPDEKREKLARAVDAKFADRVGCEPGDDALGLYVDRELYRAGMLPSEVLAAMSPQQREWVTASESEIRSESAE